MVSGDCDFEAIADRVCEACLNRNGKIARNGEIVFCCPVHDDHNPSAFFNRAMGAWLCRSCKAHGGLVSGGSHPIAKVLGIDTRDGSYVATGAPQAPRRPLPPPDPEKEARIAENRAKMAMWYLEGVGVKDLTDSLEGQAFMAERQITDLACRHFGLGLVEYGGGDAATSAVAIPWLSGAETIGLQYRLLTNDKSKRYRAAEGSRFELFNPWAIEAQDDDTLIVVEGALKCASIWSTGITNIVAVVNNDGWKPEYWDRVSGFGRVVFALDPDAEGMAMKAAMSTTGPQTFVARFPEKIDDYALRCDGDPDCIMSIIDCARRAK